MDPTERRRLSRTSLEMTAMGFGTAPIGNQFRTVSDEDAHAVIKGAWDAGLRYFDTAPMYGHGLSEHRLGEALRWYPRDEYVLSTKVGRLLQPIARSERELAYWIDPLPFNIVYDYGYDATMRSFEDSLQRLALERFDILFIHDIDHVSTHAGAPGAVFPHGDGQRLQGAGEAALRRPGRRRSASAATSGRCARLR